ncbi:MAG: hypothetical protein EXR83_11890 [Gammaproteobacteria bacterium]|nr:hypothetical protein [Gammaproteobacteria bacterium]
MHDLVAMGGYPCRTQNLKADDYLVLVDYFQATAAHFYRSIFIGLEQAVLFLHWAPGCARTRSAPRPGLQPLEGVSPQILSAGKILRGLICWREAVA